MGLGEHPVVRRDNEAAVEMTPAFTSGMEIAYKSKTLKNYHLWSNCNRPGPVCAKYKIHFLYKMQDLMASTHPKGSNPFYI